MSNWRTLSEIPIENLAEWVVGAAGAGQNVHIGTDSMQTSRNTQFVTVVVIHTPGKGGRVAYTRKSVPRIASLREKLLKEVWESVMLALELNPVIKGSLTVHIDANTEPRHRSAKYAEELAGLVMAQGFKYLLKPESWAATHVGDWTVRHLGRERG